MTDRDRLEAAITSVALLRGQIVEESDRALQVGDLRYYFDLFGRLIRVTDKGICISDKKSLI